MDLWFFWGRSLQFFSTDDKVGVHSWAISSILGIYQIFASLGQLVWSNMMNVVTPTIRESSARAQKLFVPPKELGAVWDALIDDAHVAVMVLDAQGVIEYANVVASNWFGLGSAEGCVGKRCCDFMPSEIMEERLGIAKERLAAGQATSVVGMCAGKLLRSTFRAISGTTGMRTLMVSRLAAPNDPMNPAIEPGVVSARMQDEGALGVLTTREMEILKLIGLGLSSADIAKRLGRSVKTVEWHRVSLGDKLNVTNRVELARIAIAAGLVDAAVTPQMAAPVMAVAALAE